MFDSNPQLLSVYIINTNHTLQIAIRRQDGHQLIARKDERVCRGDLHQGRGGVRIRLLEELTTVLREHRRHWNPEKPYNNINNSDNQGLFISHKFVSMQHHSTCRFFVAC